MDAGMRIDRGDAIIACIKWHEINESSSMID
jgi:hypothetical protein